MLAGESASLKGLHPAMEELLTATGIPPTARAEEIDLKHFCALSLALATARRG